MVSCGQCGRSGHPTCLNMMTEKLAKKVMEYDWYCIECKPCEVCQVTGEDVSGEVWSSESGRARRVLSSRLADKSGL
jgi:hypothetical protein